MPTPTCQCREDRYCDACWDRIEQRCLAQRFQRLLEKAHDQQIAQQMARIARKKEFTDFLLDVVAPGIARRGAR